MKSKPTFKEFLFINQEAIIKSSDGHYYVRNQKHHFTLGRVASFLISFIISLGSYLFISRLNLWRNVSFDIILIIILICYFILRLQYRRSKYDLVDNIVDDTEILTDSHKTLTTKKFIIFMIVFSAVTLFALLNSFSFLCIRSLFEKPNISDMSVHFTAAENPKDIRFADCENLEELSVANTEVTDIAVLIDISGTPSTYQFKLNGRLLPDSHCYKHKSYIWDDIIFKQHFSGSFEVDNLPNNSVLEMCSGSYSRQWVMKTEASS